MLKHAIIFISAILLGASLMGQVAAPDFLCVENDTLRWIPSTNACGPFQNYTIYASESEGGPYSVLATITSQADDSYYHENANSASTVWYYYIESWHDCPGAAILPSDTLDNRDPDYPLMELVSVVGDGVEIHWTPSQAPETHAYIIYREDATGNFQPIDTLIGGTAGYYLDMLANATSQSERYTITAVDACGNTSIFNTAIQASVFLQTETNPCTQNTRLSWNSYANWPEGIEKQEIWLGVNGSEPTLRAVRPAGDTAFVYGPLSDGDDYCFHVRTYRSGGGWFSASNEVCFTAEITEPNRNLALLAASVAADNSGVELVWQWDDDAEIVQVELLESVNGSEFEVAQSFTPTFPLQREDSLALTNTYSGNKTCYQIRTRDECDSVRTSNTACLLNLRGEALADASNELTWNGANIPDAAVQLYQVYQSDPYGGYEFLSNVPLGQTDYRSGLDPLDANDARACYYVTILNAVTLEDGTSVTRPSRSNTLCLEQFSQVRFPNAFAPSGKNKEFRPIVLFPDLVVGYELQVFDRWGKMVFRSDDYNIGWDGVVSGKSAPQGVYAYYMEIIQADGKRESREGTVMLVE